MFVFLTQPTILQICKGKPARDLSISKKEPNLYQNLMAVYGGWQQLTTVGGSWQQLMEVDDSSWQLTAVINCGQLLWTVIHCCQLLSTAANHRQQPSNFCIYRIINWRKLTIVDGSWPQWMAVVNFINHHYLPSTVVNCRQPLSKIPKFIGHWRRLAAVDNG